MKASLRVSTPSALPDMLHRALNRNSHLAGRNIRIEQHDSRIVLKGVVHSYFEKQLAQESIREINGVELIQNEIEVVSI